MEKVTLHSIIRQIASMQLLNWKSREVENVLAADKEQKEDKQKYPNIKLVSLQDRIQIEGPAEQVKSLLEEVGCGPCF